MAGDFEGAGVEAELGQHGGVEVGDVVAVLGGVKADFVGGAVGELRQTLEQEHRDEFIAIEPISRTYYLGRTMVEATRQARAMFPGRRSYLMRVGHASAMQIGWYEP